MVSSSPSKSRYHHADLAHSSPAPAPGNCKSALCFYGIACSGIPRTHSITQHMAFGEWLPSLSIILRSMRVVAGIDPSFFLRLNNDSGIFIKVNTCSIKIAGVKEEAPASAKCKWVTLNLGFLVCKKDDNHSNQTHLAEWLGDKRRYLYAIIHFPNVMTCDC